MSPDGSPKSQESTTTTMCSKELSNLKSYPHIKFPHAYNTPQGLLLYPRFTLPPLDGSMVMNEFIDWHMDHSPTHTFALLTPEGVEDSPLTKITYDELGRAVHALGAQFLEQIPRPPDGHPFENPNAKPQIVGILANVDALLYDLIILSLWRAGYTPFPLSPRNSVAALRHLMTKTGCDVLIGSIPDEEGGRGSALEITTERLVESLDVDITLIPIPDIFDFLPSLNPSLTPIPSHSSNSSSPSPSPSTDASVAGDREDAIERLPPIPYPQCQSWTSIIIHSSGSTSFPKPISFPQKHTLQWSHFTWFGEQDLGTPSPAPILRQKDTGDSVGDFVAAAGVDGAKSTGRGEKGADGGNGGGEVDEGWSGGEVTSSGMSLPGFHAIGVGCQIGVPFTTGAVVSYFLPTHHKTPVPLTAPNVLAGMVNTGVRYSFGLPTHFEEWSNSVECMDKLLPQKGMIVGGGPLAAPSGSRLIQHGVNIITGYGLTETALIWTKFPRRNLGEDWQYGSFASFVKPRFRLFSQAEQTYLVDLFDETESGDGYSPPVLNVEEGGKKGFCTNDLFVKHPTKEGLWKIVGRADDQIGHANGEKTNPVPMENIILGHPLVKGAVMFGAGRNSCGIIIEPASPLPSSSRPSSPPLPSPPTTSSPAAASFPSRASANPNPALDPLADPQSAQKQAFLNEIWSQIDLANTHAPSHSRLFPSMILITDPTSKPFARTPKETVLRGRVLEEFKGEIEALYARLDAKDAMAKEGDVDESVEWGEEESVKAFVRSVVESVMTPRVGGVDEEGDLFAQGCDSLQASFIRNKILKALDASFSAGSAGISIRGKVGTNVVFEYPSVGKLSAYLVEVVASTGGYSTGSANGVEHVNGDGHLNGYADGHLNGYADGHLNGYADGHLNGYADGHLNGYADGHVNGSTKTNGANGHANGTTNGVNGIKKENAGRETEVERRVRAMRAMLHKYSSNWPPSPPSIPSLSTPHSTASKSVSATTNGVRTKVGEAVGARGGGGAGGGECVLVTGTTGALGTYILSSLILSPRLNMIWALNRPSPSSSPKSLLERQSEAFDERGIGRGVLEDAIKTGKVVLLEGSPSPLSSSSASQWDLPAATFTEIVGSVTSIIHNAWKLDFNQSLSSFESNVAQTRYILDLAHLASTSRSSSRSPAAAAATPNGKTERKNVHVMFTSSISTVSNYTANVNGKGKGRVPEEFINDPSVAVGSGYGESKWVADALLHRIATSSPSPHMKTDGAIKVTSFRIGQLCGSTMNGAWNGSDWVPIILRSCVPPSGAGAGAGESGVVVPVFGEDKRVCWVPVDVAANSIVDSMFVPHTEAGAEGEGGYRTFNIVHPNPTSWNTIFHSFAASLSPPSSPLKAKGIKTVEIGKWVEELKEDAANEEGGEEIMKRRPAIKILSFLEHGIASTSPSSGIPNGPTTTKSNGHVNGNTNDHAIGNGNGHINSSAKPTIDEHEEKEAMGMARLDTSRMESASEAFRGMKKIDERDVEKWVGWWKERGIVGAGASGL